METSFFLLQKNLHLITVCNGTLKVSETQNKTFYWFCWKITIISFSKSSPGAVSSQWLLSPKFSWLCTYPHSVSSLIQDMNKKKRSEALNRKKKKMVRKTEPKHWACWIIPIKYYNCLGSRRMFFPSFPTLSPIHFRSSSSVPEN